MIFAANHVSHLDTPVILAALPPVLASAGGPGHGSGVVPAALSTPWVLLEGEALRQPPICSGVRLLQRLPPSLRGWEGSAAVFATRASSWTTATAPWFFPRAGGPPTAPWGIFSPESASWACGWTSRWCLSTWRDCSGCFRPAAGGPRGGRSSVTFGEPVRLDPEQGVLRGGDGSAPVREKVASEEDKRLP